MKKTLKLAFIGIGITLLIAFFLKGKIPHKQFDSTKWKNWVTSNSESDWSLRWDMMNSLRNNHQLKGMTKEEVINLLGNPQSQNNNEFGYNLGYSKHGINTASLRIVFGADNRVNDFYVWQG